MRQERRGDCEHRFLLTIQTGESAFRWTMNWMDMDGVLDRKHSKFVDGGGVNEYAVTTKSMQQLQ